jgi:hypothetical protein
MSTTMLYQMYFAGFGTVCSVQDSSLFNFRGFAGNADNDSGVDQILPLVGSLDEAVQHLLCRVKVGNYSVPQGLDRH